LNGFYSPSSDYGAEDVGLTTVDVDAMFTVGLNYMMITMSM